MSCIAEIKQRLEPERAYEYRIETWEDETGDTIYRVLASRKDGEWKNILIADYLTRETAVFLSHAPTDIAYLLNELEAEE